jgi:predicted RNase H-like nuclease
MPPIIVAGADITKGRWVVVVLADGRFESSTVVDTLPAALEDLPHLRTMAVDIPIGLPRGGDDYPRAADSLARQRLGPRRSSVFPAPARPVLDCADYAEANALHRTLTGRGMSRQTWALKAAILQAEEAARRDHRIIEAHPEVTFLAMQGHPLDRPKRSWNGMNLRVELLRRHGVVVPAPLEGAGSTPSDDILDAAAAAWTAHRFATGEGQGLGDPTVDLPNPHAGRIWW